jgi:hypothetical protein
VTCSKALVPCRCAAERLISTHERGTRIWNGNACRSAGTLRTALLLAYALHSLQSSELSPACVIHLQGEATELHVPLLESDEINSDTGAAAGHGDASVHEGDVEQGLVAGSDAEAGSNKSEEDCAVAVSYFSSVQLPRILCCCLDSTSSCCCCCCCCCCCLP